MVNLISKDTHLVFSIYVIRIVAYITFASICILENNLFRIFLFMIYTRHGAILFAGNLKILWLMLTKSVDLITFIFYKNIFINPILHVV